MNRIASVVVGLAAVLVSISPAISGDPDRQVPNQPSLQSSPKASQPSPQDSAVDAMGWDHSGQGAVLCIWEILVLARNSVLVCPGTDDAWEHELMHTVDRINDFIVANSKQPVRKIDLQRRITERLSSLRGRAASMRPNALEKACREGDFARLIYVLPDDAIRVNLQKDMDELLAVPREPVMNPCL